jgi:hypothetical protein
MDEKLQAQMEEARAQGYTEEQIKEFLNPQPTARPDLARDESGQPVSPFVNRGEEAVATGQYGAAEAAKYAALGGAGVYGARKVAQALRPGPVAPSSLPITGSAAHSEAIIQSPSGQAASRPPTMMERGVDMAKKMRDIAASRVTPIAQAVAPIARAATGVGAMVMPGNMGQEYPFPQKGPMRGMEINPNTGQPWTPAELQQYNQAY